MEIEFEMTLPDMTTFKDIHGGMTFGKLTFMQICSFLKVQEKSFDKKIVDLYDQR